MIPYHGLAKKLCPQLVFISPNFKKYEEAAKQMREVYAEYDKNGRAMSLDESYLDLTDYVKARAREQGVAIPPGEQKDPDEDEEEEDEEEEAGCHRAAQETPGPAGQSPLLFFVPVCLPTVDVGEWIVVAMGLVVASPGSR